MPYVSKSLLDVKGSNISPLESRAGEKDDEYVKKMKDNGLPGEEVLAFCLDRLKKLP
jgi:hypothetical protein